MNRLVVAGLAGCLGLSACSNPAADQAPAQAEAYSDAWFAFSDPAFSARYRGVNMHDTEHAKAGRLVLADGSAVALRVLPPDQADGDVRFIAPALGVSYTASLQPDGEWRGRWSEPGSDAAEVVLTPRAEAIVETGGQFVVLPDGRRMHMVCTGEGSPVVVLDYGAGGTVKKDWGAIAAAIADKAQTRVCAYDRAGRGLSDPGPLPRDAAAVVADMDGMLTAAKLPPPYVLIGHSLGSYHVRLFANTLPDKVGGMVLIDPSGDGQLERFNAAIPKLAELQAAQTSAQAELDCVNRLRAAPVPPNDPLVQQCGGNDPDAMEATLSEIEQMPGASTQQLTASHRSYDDMPLVVLTRTDYERDMPPDFTAEDRANMRKIWEEMHADMAALSQQSWHRFVPGASHYIQRDNPEAVVEAAADVVAALRAASH